MLTIITGAPGSGKTLWTLPEIEKLRETSNRPVFYWRIPELKLPWTELTDPEKWHECPTGAIIVMDEAHKVFPNRSAGTRAPDHVQPIDEHRHRGHDVFLITQHHGELDFSIRRRCGRHVHLERRFGLPRARVFEWQRLADYTNFHDRKDAVGSEFIFPKAVFGLYKSADLHTTKTKLPKGPLIKLGLALTMVVGCALYAVHFFTSGRLTGGKQQPLAGNAPAVSAPTLTPAEAQHQQADRWAARFAERVQGVPYSASMYDGVAIPVSMPKISGCAEVKINYRVNCSCNTQQGTRITTMTVAQCQFYVKNGWFDFARRDQEEQTTKDNSGTHSEPSASSSGATGAAS